MTQLVPRLASYTAAGNHGSQGFTAVKPGRRPGGGAGPPHPAAVSAGLGPQAGGHAKGGAGISLTMNDNGMAAKFLPGYTAESPSLGLQTPAQAKGRADPPNGQMLRTRFGTGGQVWPIISLLYSSPRSH